MTEEEQVAIYAVCKALDVHGQNLGHVQVLSLIEIQRRILIRMIPAMSRTKWYVASQSEKRRMKAAEKGICIFCSREPVTPGLHGKKHVPYSSCLPCREARRDLMRKIREGKKSRMAQEEPQPIHRESG